MKKLCLIVLFALWSVVFVAQGFGRETGTDVGTGKAAGPVKVEKAGKQKARGGSGFVGVVVAVDQTTKIISVKGRGRIVTFDASSPTFRGFRRLEDVKVGTYAAVSYTRDGTRISKASKREAAAGPERSEERPTAAKKEPRKRIARVQAKGISFFDVDENKDGKITPVELSVVVSDLTMEQFKAHDKNGDGCLNQSEYGTVRASR